MTATLAADITILLETAAHTRRTRHTAKARRTLEGKLRTAFRAQGAAFLRRLAWAQSTEAAREYRLGFAGAVGGLHVRPFVEAAEPNWEDDWDAVALATVQAFLEPLTLAVQASLRAGATYLLAQMQADVSFDLANPRAVAYLNGHGAELVTKINAETRATLQTIISGGVANGDSYSAIAKAIRTEFTDMSRTRAQRIAVYETGAAYVAGNDLMARQLVDAGLELEHSWLSVGDSKVRPEHAANEGEGWIPFDQAFSSGDLMPPTDPGCRCDRLIRRKPEEGDAE